MNKVIYETAAQAIAVSKFIHLRHGLSVEQSAQFCQDNEGNRRVLEGSAEHQWEEGEVHYYRVLKPLEVWTVMLKEG